MKLRLHADHQLRFFRRAGDLTAEARVVYGCMSLEWRTLQELEEVVLRVCPVITLGKLTESVVELGLREIIEIDEELSPVSRETESKPPPPPGTRRIRL